MSNNPSPLLMGFSNEIVWFQRGGVQGIGEQAREPPSNALMSRMSPQIVGIVGGSCAGKSWLAARLASRAGAAVARISQDDFYLDRAHLSAGRRARLNFDHPRAIDWAKLEGALAALQGGAAAAVPRYDFATHSRFKNETAVNPAPLIVVEGLWLFRRRPLRKLFDLRIFIRGEEKLRAERRMERDMAERGRTREQVLEQWRRFAEPMHHRFVAPQERWADVVLEAPVKDQDVDKIADRLGKEFLGTIGI
jgi:uridine kinase